LCLFLPHLLSSSLTQSLSYVLSNDSKNAKEKKILRKKNPQTRSPNHSCN
jgi:hypothetical protein